jgi:large subunit ribosomal protein L9
MKIILLKNVEKLGGIGDVVNVKNGFARNFLLPQRCALRSTIANLEYFASKKAELEADNLRLKTASEEVASKMADVSLIIVRQASESGMLFGSVRAEDVASSLVQSGFAVTKKQIKIASPIKTIGNYVVKVMLHPEVFVDIPVRVLTSREQEEAKIEQDLAQGSVLEEHDAEIN